MANKFDSLDTCYSFSKIDEKTPIVFIHGVGLTKEIWEPQINFFKNYNTLTYDLLGHGKTPLKKNQLKIDSFTNQLLKLIEELNIDKVHLIGFSLGSLIARDFAAQHSNKLASLIIHGTIYKRTEDQKKIVINRYETIKLNREVTKKRALVRWFSDEFIKKNPKIYKKIYEILEENKHENLLKSYKIFAYYEDDYEMIKKIHSKTLITTGQNDIGSTPEMSKKLSEQIKGSKFKEIKNGKHLCNIECADDVNITFKKFIDQHNE
jgi:pimeloyl-ACP methyl ester carboxylesterase